jgi:hypothetical protein
MEIGDAIGWRAWRVVEDGDGVRLASVLYEDRWPDGGPLGARCERGHRAPDFECTCGIYAAKRRELALPYRIGRDDAATLGRVLGLVVLSGDVVEHRDGWRGSHGRPLRVWADPDLAAALCRRYIDVDVAPTLRRWTSASSTSFRSASAGSRPSRRSCSAARTRSSSTAASG